MSYIPQFRDLPELDFTGGWTLDKIQGKLESDYGEYMIAHGERGELSASDPMELQIMAVTQLLYQQTALIDRIGKSNFLQYANGADLDNLASFKKLTRKKDSKAEVMLKFSMTAPRQSATPIPAGIRVTTEDLKYFAVASYTEIPIGEKSVECKAFALESGEKMNGIKPGEIKQIVDPLPYIAAVENINTSGGGKDIESDEDFTYRVYMAPSGYSVAGPQDAYEYYAYSYRSDITDVSVTSPAPKEVSVMFLLSGGVIPDEETMEGMKEYLSGKTIRPLTDLVKVSAPTEVEYNINLTYYIARSNSSQAVTIQTAVQAAITEYQSWQRKMERDINPSKLIESIVTAGAKRCIITEPAFKIIGAGQIPKAGTVSVTYGGIEDD